MNWNEIHSILFVPAQKRRLDKIKDLKADAYIIDLEDAIKEQEKDNSREAVKEYLSNRPENSGSILLRINPEELSKESSIFGGNEAVDCIVIPKVESAVRVRRVREAFPDKDLMALIETPMGMLNLREILATGNVSAIGFGAEDYCAVTGTRKEKEYLIPLQSRLIMYGSAYGVPVYDMINAEFRNLDKYEEYVKTAKDLGFTGKMAIHPNQTGVINRIFRNPEKAAMEEVLRKYEEGSDGFMIIDGEIYEQPHIERIHRMMGSDPDSGI